MPKLNLVCEKCGSDFSVFPSAIKWAEKRGVKIHYCSRACVGLARSDGNIKAKRRHGKEFSCPVCKKAFYRSPKRIKKDRVYTCSEKCRIIALKEKIIDRTKPRPERRLGEEIQCMFCGKKRYRKKSMIERRIAMTCGDKKCVSAYGRSLWNLPPFSEKERKLSKGQSRRKTNFNAKQRISWLGSQCKFCGSKENLCLDHIIPVSAGGESIKENSQTLCQPCNIWKGNHIDRELALAYNKSNQAANFNR